MKFKNASFALFLLPLFVVFVGISPLQAQSNSRFAAPNSRTIAWGQPETTNYTETEKRTFLTFEGANYDPQTNFLPLYHERIRVPVGTTDANVNLLNPVFENLDRTSLQVLGFSAGALETAITPIVSISYERRVPYAEINFIPLRRNPSTGLVERLVRFDVQLTPTNNPNRNAPVSPAFANGSVLATGTWFRVGTTRTGVHKMDRAFFENLGVDVASVDPRNIRIYANGRGMLSFNNNLAHADDLLEHAIYVQGENDGVFDESDYVLFYALSPHVWKYNTTTNRFYHQVHQYSDTAFYFINIDLGAGKRVALQATSSQTPTHSVVSFDDFQYHESDNTNLIKSGREWYGEEFNIIAQYSFGFSFPNIDLSTNAWVKVDMISRYEAQHTYSVTAQAASGTVTVPFSQVNSYYSPYAAPANTQLTFAPTGSVISVNVSRNQSGAIGWLNYIEVNVRRQLRMVAGQLLFRDEQSAGTGNVAAFTLTAAGSGTIVWDVTDLANVAQQNVTSSNGNYLWTLATDSMREFVAFDGTLFYTPSAKGSVANQNLHGLNPVDYIIVAHPLFLQEASELAQIHADINGLSSVIVTPQQIYNEFSSGMQDVTAIRDFVRMLYFKTNDPDSMPRYLLLFGDGSYDNKSRLSGNSNYIPTFQNYNSLGPTESYVSDEFYGLLDDVGTWDGGSDVGYVDVGIGRFPTRTREEAGAIINKIRRYTQRTAPVLDPSSCSADQCANGGEWRNWLSFIGDDEDADIHMDQSDDLATYVDTAYDNYNIDKIFFDAYQQEQTPGGERYPGVTEAIDRRIAKGCLIMNYTGHGGEVGLAHERVIDVPQINGWTNLCNLPLFVTATCEFSRFDDPGRTSAGEYVLLNANGGGIGLFTTVRLVYSTPNFILNTNFYKCAFKPINGEMPAVGDIYRITKNTSGNSTNNRNFTLLGDPALKLNYPQNEVITTHINNVPLTQTSSDTLRALNVITVSGYVADTAGNIMSGFNGVVYPTVFDKPTTIVTLANDPPNLPFTYQLQKSILYRGKVTAVNGQFTFSFVVPRDIAFQYGPGRISYYADNGITDAHGNYEKLVVGGTSTNAPVDVTGPQVKLYMNDSNFVSGGITDESPKLYAVIVDSNGVNTVGNGIGHDIVAILDEETDNAIVLNDYYQADLNSYKSGKIIYPFDKLAPGTHTLSLKVWDVYNNSSKTTTEFVVSESANLALEHVLNYPNPFTTKTSFFFEHNQQCEEYDTQIQIFTTSGKLVKTINQRVHTAGYRSDPIEWDGKDDYGDNIGRGVYVYRVFVRSTDGKTAERYEKLVILN